MNPIIKTLILILMFKLILNASYIKDGKKHTTYQYSTFEVTLTQDLLTNQKDGWITSKTEKQADSKMYVVMIRHKNGIKLYGYAGLQGQKTPLRYRFDNLKVNSVPIKNDGYIHINIKDANKLDKLMIKQSNFTIEVITDGKRRYVLTFSLKGYANAYKKYINWISNK